MRYQQLSSDVYIHNRQRLTAAMEPGTLAIFNSNDILPTSADGALPFKQATDLFHPVSYTHLTLPTKA